MLTPQEYHAKITAPLGLVTTAMERHGVPFDVPAARALRERVAGDESRSRCALGDWCERVGYVAKEGGEYPPNWGSWQQLQRFLYTDAGLNLKPSPYWKKGSTGYGLDGEIVSWNGEAELKTDDVALKWLASEHPEHAEGLEHVRNLRWEQRVGSYLDKWLGLALRHYTRWDPRQEPWDWLHPSFGLASDRDERAGAVTGRFAIKNPALAQVPVHGDDYNLRGLFVAPPGWVLVIVDYSQLEIVVLAHVCNALFGTDGLCQRVAPGAPDMHSDTARYVFGKVLGDTRLLNIDLADFKKLAKEERDLSKAVRYGTNYCKSIRGFADSLFDKQGKALGMDRAEAMVNALYEFDPEIPMYQGWVREFITRHREIVSLYGRRCYLPDARAVEKGLRNRAWRRACNYPMQAGAQEITALAMLAIHADREFAALGACMLLQVHDEIVCMVPAQHGARAREIVEYHMKNAVKLRAHLTVSGGVHQSWAGGH